MGSFGFLLFSISKFNFFESQHSSHFIFFIRVINQVIKIDNISMIQSLFQSSLKVAFLFLSIILTTEDLQHYFMFNAFEYW